MPLITTPGAIDADSYASLTFADAWHAMRGHTAWAAATVAAREAAKRRSTLWLDARFRRRFPGSPTFGRDQALEWPRIDARDCYGRKISSTIIPVEVMKADAEAALYELEEPGMLMPVNAPATQEQVEKSITAGPVSITYADSATSGGTGGAAPAPHIPAVIGLLAPLLAVTGSVVELYR